MLLSRCVQYLISEIWHYSKVTYVEGGTEDVSSYTLHGLCCSAGYDCPYHRGCQDIHRRDIDRDTRATRENCDSRPRILPKVCLTMQTSLELIGPLLDPLIELKADGAATHTNSGLLDGWMDRSRREKLSAHMPICWLRLSLFSGIS